MNEEHIKKIVITGAGGFLGSNLVSAFEGEDEYFVYALSSRADSLQQINTNANVQFFHRDVVFSDKGAQMFENATIVNCAFPRNTDGFEMADGLKYIQRLFDRSVYYNAEAIINISSQSVYSQKREEPATEETPLCLDSPYAVGKYATELMLKQVCKNGGTVYTNIRLSSLIGPGFNQRMINRITEKALNREPIVIVESGSEYGLLDICDAVRGIQTLINLKPYNWSNIYNFGGATNYSVTEIYNELKQVLIERKLPLPDANFEQSGEKISSSINSEKFFNETGFYPSVTLKESIENIVSWYLENK